MKKTVSLILAVMLLIAVIPVFSTPASAAGYDAGAAVAWATDRSAHNSVSNLVCSQYVCRCLQAGGLAIPYETCSQYPNRISTWVTKNGYGTIMDVSEDSMYKMKAGDVILVMCAGHESRYAYGIHCIFVTGVNTAARTFTYSANNSFHHNDTMSFNTLKSYAQNSCFSCYTHGLKYNFSCILSMKGSASASNSTPPANKPAKASKSGYNPGAAVAWAADGNTHQSVSGLAGSQYVCRCLQAGGLGIPYDSCSQYPNRISTWVVNNGYGKIMDVSDSAIKKMKAGDVILAMCSGHESKYAYGIQCIFVTSVNKEAKTFQYCSNNNYHHNETMSFSDLKNYANNFSCYTHGKSHVFACILSMNSSSAAAPKQNKAAAKPNVPVDSLAITSGVFMEAGSVAKLKSVVSPTNATDKTISWTSSNTAIATVDQKGTVTALQPGVCTVTASAGGKQATCEVRVVDHNTYQNTQKQVARYRSFLKKLFRW